MSIEQFGDLLNIMLVGISPLMLLPVAMLVRARLLAAATPFLGTLLIGTAIYVFGALAVDVSAPNLSPWAIGLAALVAIGAGSAIWHLTAHKVSERLSRPLETGVRTMGRVTTALVILMALVQFCVVIMRYVFGINFIAMQESITYFHGAAFLLASGYALLTNDHVRVDILYSRASPQRRAVIDLFGTYLFLVPFCFITLWAAGPYVANAWSVREGSAEQSGIQGIFLLKSFIPIFGILLLGAGFVNARRAAGILTSPTTEEN